MHHAGNRVGTQPIFVWLNYVAGGGMMDRNMLHKGRNNYYRRAGIIFLYAKDLLQFAIPGKYSSAR